MMKKNKKGLTLLELTTTIVIFSLFTLILFSCLIFGAKYSHRIESKSDLYKSIIKANENIGIEYRQSLPYRTVINVLHTMRESDIILPNAASSASSEIIFTIPHYSYFPDNLIALTFESPQSVQTIRFYIANNNSLIREQIIYGSTGQISRREKRAILLLTEKTLQIEAQYRNSHSIRITLNARDNLNHVSFSSNIFTESQ